MHEFQEGKLRSIYIWSRQKMNSPYSKKTGCVSMILRSPRPHRTIIRKLYTGILQSPRTMEQHYRCLFWNNVGCGWPVRCGNNSPCGRGHRRSLTLACLHGLQPFVSFFLCAAERASLRTWRDLSAQSVSRLTVWELFLPICSGLCFSMSLAHIFESQLWPACGTFSLHKFTVEEVLGDTSIVNTHDVAEPAHTSVSAAWTCWCIQLCPGQCCLGPCPARWCSECVWGCAFAFVGSAMSRTHCHIGGCSRRRLNRSGSLCAQSACCCSMLSLSIWSWW